MHKYVRLFLRTIRISVLLSKPVWAHIDAIKVSILIHSNECVDCHSLIYFPLPPTHLVDQQALKWNDYISISVTVMCFSSTVKQTHNYWIPRANSHFSTVDCDVFSWNEWPFFCHLIAWSKWASVRVGLAGMVPSFSLFYVKERSSLRTGIYMVVEEKRNTVANKGALGLWVQGQPCTGPYMWRA